MRGSFLRMLVLGALALHARAALAELPRFTIESIRIEGTRFTSPHILVAESRLVEGQSYAEADLRHAIGRINRLPFVLHTDFHLEKGSARGKYVLVVSIVEAKPVFVSFQSLQEAMATVRIISVTFDPDTQTVSTELAPMIARHNEETSTIGARWFVGGNGVAIASVDRGPDTRYSAGYTQYDVLGTRASINVLAQVREVAALPAEFAGDPAIGDRLALQISAALPVFDNQAIRATWYRQSDPYLIGGAARYLHDDRAELSWIYDTTNDQLFPTSGVVAKMGLESKKLYVFDGTRFDGRWNRDAGASAAKYWEVTPLQTLALHGSAHSVSDRAYREYQIGGGYSASLWDRERTIRHGDLRVELEAERNFLHYGDATSYATARAGLAFRNAWGVVRLDFRYLGWRHGGR